MMNTNRLTKEMCLEFLRDYGTPNHVVAHCTAVSNVAATIGKALNNNGFDFDIELIETAALMHDMARIDDKHWEVSADFLESRGFKKQAEIVRVHMHHRFPEDPMQSSEADIVCLADRLVMEDQYVGLHERMEYIIKKAGDQPVVIQRIEANKVLVGEYIAKLEKLMKRPIEDIVREQE